MWIAVVLILATTALLLFKSCRDLPGDALKLTGQAMTNVSKALLDVATAWNQRTITTSFTSYATQLNQQQFLQFATLKQTEVFTQSDQSTTAFGYIPLPEVVVEARAPIEYTYYLDLNADWDFLVQDNIIHVRAPRIRFNKPAIDVSAIAYQTRKGSILRSDAEAQENLKKTLSLLAQLRAKENIPLVRETGRKQVAEFVEKWLSKSFTDGSNFAVKVYFPDEKTPLPPHSPTQKLD